MERVSLFNLRYDLEVVFNEQYHPRVHDLLNILVLEEIPELIQKIENVYKFIGQCEESVGSGTAFDSFKETIDSLKRAIE